MKKEAFEEELIKLKGLQIKRVFYFEIPYEGGVSHWNDYVEFDTVDHGVKIETSNNRIFSITWDNRFYCYGISFEEMSLREKLTNFSEWEVTQNNNWKDCIGEVVEGVISYWSTISTIGESEISYPQDLSITFKSGKRIYFSASEFSEERGALFPMADNIIITFTSEIAKKYGIGEFQNQMQSTNC